MQKGHSIIKILEHKNKRIKINGIKIGEELWVLAGGGPPSVSVKKSQQNKDCGTKTVE